MPACARAGPATAPAPPDPARPAYRPARWPGDGGCRCRDRAGSALLRGWASETGPAGTAQPAPAARRCRDRWRARQTAAPATIRPRTPPGTARQRSEAAPDAASFVPMRWRTSPVAAPASTAAARQHPGHVRALTGRGSCRSIKSPGWPEQQPSTAAAVRHRSWGNPHPGIRIPRRRDCGSATP